MKQATGVLFLLIGSIFWHIAASASAPKDMVDLWNDFLSVAGSGNPSSKVGTEVNGAESGAIGPVTNGNGAEPGFSAGGGAESGAIGPATPASHVTNPRNSAGSPASRAGF